MSRHDGGAAFPRTGYYPPPMPSGDWDHEAWAERKPTLTTPERGLSVRDYFAAHALQGLLAFSPGHPDRVVAQYDPDDAARTAYAMADAMLAERGKPQGGAE